MEPTPIEKIIRDYPALEGITFEDILDLEAVPLSIQTGDQEILDCKDFMEVDRLPIHFLIAQIPCAAFIPLFIEASRMQHDDEKYITGLKIYFGLNPTDLQQLFPIFQPLYLPRNNRDEEHGQYRVTEGFIYQFDGESFIPIQSDQAEQYKQLYKNNIRIMQSGGLGPGFIEGIDVEAVIFPFQTIFTLMCDNPGLAGVFLYNAIRRSITNTQDRGRHCILLSYKNQNLLGDLHNQYANRSHLCPPDCSLLLYNVYQYK